MPDAATVRPAPLAAFRLVVRAVPDPSVLPKVFGLFAKNDCIPSHVEARCDGAELVVEITAALDADRMHYLGRQVETWFTTRSAAVAPANARACAAA